MATGAGGTPGAFLKDLPVGCYVRVADVPGSAAARRSALSRAAARGDLVRLRRGLYFKGTVTRYGTSKPAPIDVAREILADTGVGPTGLSAARALDLTTQLPAVPQLVTAGRVPAGVAGVSIHRRSNVGRCALSFTEVALLEVLRDWCFIVEGGWAALVAAVRSRLDRGEIDLTRLAGVASGERHRQMRTAWAVLLRDLGRDDLLSATAWSSAAA